MSSGIAIPDEVVDAYQKVQGSERKYQWVSFKIADDAKKVVVCDKGEIGNDTPWEDFVDRALPKDDTRWAVYDFKWQTNEGQDRQKPIMISWAPDDLGIKKKMVHSSSNDALKKKFTGIHAYIQANDFSDVEKQAVVDKCNGK